MGWTPQFNWLNSKEKNVSGRSLSLSWIRGEERKLNKIESKEEGLRPGAINLVRTGNSLAWWL
jgi:hypothetical protein